QNRLVGLHGVFEPVPLETPGSAVQLFADVDAHRYLRKFPGIGPRLRGRSQTQYIPFEILRKMSRHTTGAATSTDPPQPDLLGTSGRSSGRLHPIVAN